MAINLNRECLGAGALHVVGVSGGPDSLCLLDLLRKAQVRLVVAHFNHRLRSEAQAEAEMVAGLADRTGLPFVTESADVRDFASAEGLSIEVAARLLRYRFLFSQARQLQACCVVTAHTADDQVETILMNFLRGTGLSGLKGMVPRVVLPEFDDAIWLARPILHVWREETEAYCRKHDLQPVFDPSNEDQAYLRNSLRHRLIPALERYNPRFKAAVLRMADALRGDHSLLSELIEAACRTTMREVGAGFVAFDLASLSQVSPGMVRNLVRHAARMLRPDLRDIDHDVLARASNFVSQIQALPPAAPGSRCDLSGGLYLYAETDALYLAVWEADLPMSQWPQVTRGRLWNLDEQVDLGNGWLLSASRVNAATAMALAQENDDPYQAWIDMGVSGDRLLVRPRRAGDRFQPLGMDKGMVKISDFFVNVKLPRRARAKWPVVCAGEQIVWVPGFRLAHPFRLTKKTQSAAQLTLWHASQPGR